jgi:DNA-directed RNA polymerase specialized sigma24 family protein
MVRPLSKDGQGGTRYERPQAVEAKIAAALNLDSAAVLARAKLSDPKNAEYLSSECLVHLIREALRRRDEKTFNTLLPTLLRRCEANLLRTVDDRMPGAAQIREDILSEFGLMFAQDGSEEHGGELDYYECRFNRAFRALRIDHIRVAKAALEPLVPLPASRDDGADETPDEEVLAGMSESANHKATQEDHVYLGELIRAIENLAPDLRQAFVLCRIFGYEEESEDPSKRTAATICGVTGRTVRNRLARADKQLKRLKEDL